MRHTHQPGDGPARRPLGGGDQKPPPPWMVRRISMVETKEFGTERADCMVRIFCVGKRGAITARGNEFGPT